MDLSDEELRIQEMEADAEVDRLTEEDGQQNGQNTR